MDVDMLKSSTGDHMEVMTMMMQMEERLPEFCDSFHNASTYPSGIEFSSGSTSCSIATIPPIFHSAPINNLAPPTLINIQPSSLPFIGNPNIDQEPLNIYTPPLQAHVVSERFRNASVDALSLRNSCEKKNSSMAAMREMIFRIAAMQPIHIDPESVKPPKRRNVKISKDPQSVAARHRRERISERIRILQRLVPGGTKMDTASMLDEAIHYVKFLKKQVQTLEQAGANRTLQGGGFPGMITSSTVSDVNYSSLVKACQPTQMVLGSMGL